jgi:hypothetical protein
MDRWMDGWMDEWMGRWKDALKGEKCRVLKGAI